MALVKQPVSEVLEYIKSNYFCVDGKLFNKNGKEVCFTLMAHKNLPYSYLQIGNRRYKRCHIVWFLARGFWPRMNILHKDGDRLNDKIENLEECTVSERHSRRANSRMYKGFSVYKEKDKIVSPWRAKNYKYRVELGYFETEEAAKAKIDEFQTKGCQWWGL